MTRKKKATRTKSQLRTPSIFSGIQLRFTAIFLLIFFALQYGYSANRGGIVEHFLIDIATVLPGTLAVNLIAPEVNAQANGHRIVSTRGSISILNGCEGTEALFLLIAAILAFKAPWRQKLSGILVGTLIVYALNQVRIIALFFAAQHDRKWFDLLHGIIAPTLIIVLSILFFLWWTNRNGVGMYEQERAA